MEAFAIYLASFTFKMTIHFAKKAQIALLTAKKNTVSAKYLDYTNVYLKELVKVI